MTRTEGGALLVADRVGWKEVGVILFFASAVALNLWVFTIEDLDLTRRINSVVYGIVALAALVGYEKDYRHRKRLRGVSLSVRPWPLRLGDEVKAQLRIRPVSAVAAKLECVEHVVSGVGKFEETKTATLYTLELADSEWTFVIPDHLPPSLDVKHNRVMWRIVAMVESGKAEVMVPFELLVIPEVVG